MTFFRWISHRCGARREKANIDEQNARWLLRPHSRFELQRTYPARCAESGGQELPLPIPLAVLSAPEFSYSKKRDPAILSPLESRCSDVYGFHGLENKGNFATPTRPALRLERTIPVSVESEGGTAATYSLSPPCSFKILEYRRVITAMVQWKKPFALFSLSLSFALLVRSTTDSRQFALPHLLTAIILYHY